MSENPELPAVPHPNWVALSTCHLRFKKFVRAREADRTIQEEKGEGGRLDGEEIRQFYDQTVTDEQFAVQDVVEEVKNEDVVDIVSSDDEIEVIEDSNANKSDDEIEVTEDSNANKKLLDAVQNNQLELVRNLGDCDYNCQDQYGWTALEIACVLGHRDIVKFLLTRGGYIRDNRKIFRILTSKGLTDIIQVLRRHHDNTVEPELIDVDEAVEVNCDVCGEMFDREDKATHIASVHHQLSVERDLQSRPNPGFGISEANKGFQMLRSAGWDGRGGLGVGGRLFPVKTVLREDRVGLREGDKREARVTHFGPGDERGVVWRGKNRRTTKVKVTKKVKRGSKTRKVVVGKEQVLREDLGEL